MPTELRPATVATAAAIAIGNELLSGKVRESNVHYLALTLRALGIKLTRVSVIPDERSLIASEVKELRAEHDVVFTSGGIGPTHDDVTIAAIADAFGVPVDMDPKMRALLERVYGERLTDDHLRMALVPQGAALFETEEVQWPTVVMQNVWILPGVPEIFRMKLAVVRAHLRGPGVFVSRAVFTQLEEAELKPLLDRVVAAHPEIEIGSYPKWFDTTYRTKITFDGAAEDAVGAALADFVSQLPQGEPQRVE
jgi:molybdenum cofactor synthesis domain-containing protein